MPFPMWCAHSAVSRRHAPSLRLLGSANCANAPATHHLTTGAAHATAILGAIVVVYISLSTPINSLDIMRFAKSCSLRRDKTTPPLARRIRTLTLTTGLACHHWNWDLGLGFGNSLVWDLVSVLSWSGFWVWDPVNFNARGVGLLHWRPRTLDMESCRQTFGVNKSMLADRRPDVARS